MTKEDRDYILLMIKLQMPNGMPLNENEALDSLTFRVRPGEELNPRDSADNVFFNICTGSLPVPPPALSPEALNRCETLGDLVEFLHKAKLEYAQSVNQK